MDSISQLIILALFSLHQYVPEGQVDAKYFDTVVSADTLELNVDDAVVFSAANQTCRALLKNAQKELSLSQDQLNNFFFEIIDQHKEDLLLEGSSSEKVKITIEKICSDSFSIQAFSPQDVSDVLHLLQQEMMVLTVNNIESLGNIGIFGKTHLYDRNGRDLGTLFATTDHWLSYQQISPNVSKALIAAEDRSFWVHHGVDLDSMVRMTYQMKLNDDESQLSGGSTLTMQLLKNLYFLEMEETATGDISFKNKSLRSFVRKIREWFWAKPFESYWENKNPGSSKKIILENYLNLMDYGPSIRGIDQAAKVFFKKPASDLDIAESAFIASLFKKPARYALPKNYEKYTQKRRSYVLGQMRQLSWEECLTDPISVDELQQAEKEALPLWTPPAKEKQPLDASLYIKLVAKQFIAEKIDLPLGKEIEPELVSTIDMDLQEIVQNVMRRRLDAYDSEREHDRVGPARDDRSRIANIDTDDVSSDITDLLKTLKWNFQRANKDVEFAVYLGNSTDGQAKYYFSNDNTVIKNNDDLSSVPGLKTKGLGLGSIVAIWTNPTQCKNSLDLFNSSQETKDEDKNKIQTPPEFLRLMSSCFEILDIQEDLGESSQLVRDSLIKNILDRMTSIAPRSFMEPAFILKTSKNTELIRLEDDQLIPVSLTDSHQRLFSSLLSRRLLRDKNVVWIASDAKGTQYTLQAAKLQAAAMVMDSRTGEVLAQFGGYDPKTSQFFDRSRISKRSVGSTIKPWVYYLALSKGFQPESVVQNAGARFVINSRSTYVPDNFDGKTNSDFITIEQALTQSVNKAAVGILSNPNFGPDPHENLKEVVNFLVDIGIYNQSSVVYAPSIVLGAQEASVETMTSAFTFFANGESIAEPIYFRSYKNGRGEDIRSLKTQARAVPYSENRDAVFNIQKLLTEVANKGTARALLHFPSQTLGLANCDGSAYGIEGQICFGGKTGTSSDSRDNWFMGFSRNFVIGVWVGYDLSESTHSTGGALALPIFMDIVQEGKDKLPAIEPILGH